MSLPQDTFISICLKIVVINWLCRPRRLTAIYRKIVVISIKIYDTLDVRGIPLMWKVFPWCERYSLGDGSVSNSSWRISLFSRKAKEDKVLPLPHLQVLLFIQTWALIKYCVDLDTNYLFVCLCSQSCLTLWDPKVCGPPGFSVHGILQARILGKERKVKVAQLCPTLWDRVDCTVHGILQTRILEWVAFPFSRGSSQARDRIQVSCAEGGFFTSRAIRILE